MPHRAYNPDHAELLESMTWCQELARRLARDTHRGDDAAQEAWLAAVQGGSLRRFVGARLRGWLGRSAWNRVRERRRSEASRRSREERTARPEAQESTLEVLERGEVQRRILEAVLALPEPYASTVLLRYFDGLSSAEIARREGVSGEVVRKRLSRALARLRGTLERDFGGDRSLLAALALFPGVSPGRGVPSLPVQAATSQVAPSVMRWVLGSVLFGAAGFWYLAELRPVGGTRSHDPLESAAAGGVHVAGAKPFPLRSTVRESDGRTPLAEPSSKQSATVVEVHAGAAPVLGRARPGRAGVRGRRHRRARDPGRRGRALAGDPVRRGRTLSPSRIARARAHRRPRAGPRDRSRCVGAPGR